jgi:hypothetical protein
MFGCDRRRAGAGVDRLAVVAAGLADVLLLVGHFESLSVTELQMELREVLRSGVGACIALDLAGL